MPQPGKYARRHLVGPAADEMLRLMNNTARSQAMAALNQGWAARFRARDDKDIKGFRINWSSVATPGQVRGEIQTTDSAGKPSGTKYDASATIDFAPAAGAQLLTFASLPTTGRTPGSLYHLVLRTITAGTTQTLRSYGDQPAAWGPATVWTAPDMTAPVWTQATAACPMVTLVYEDDSEDAEGMCPYTISTSNTAFGNQAAALKVDVPANETWAVDLVKFYYRKIGTPAGDLRIRVMDAANAVLSNGTITLDRALLVTNTIYEEPFPGKVTLAGGQSYRVVFDSPASANGSNCHGFFGMQANNQAVLGDGFQLSTTSDVTATPIVWTDTATSHPNVALGIDANTASGGSSGVPDIFRGPGVVTGGQLT